MNAAPVAQAEAIQPMEKSVTNVMEISTAPSPERPAEETHAPPDAEAQVGPDAQADEDTDGARLEAPPPDNLYQFPAPSKRGRPRKSGDDYRVSVEQVSKHTYAVRLRWKRADGVEDGVVVNRLRDDIVREIKRSKKRYEQFKAQTIASWKSRAVRQSHGA